MKDKETTMMTIDDSIYSMGVTSPTSIIIITKNRYEVLKRIKEHGKFNRHDISFSMFLDDLEKEGIILGYKSIMRIEFNEVWA